MLDLRANTARFTFKIASHRSELLVVGFKGDEQLSKPFEFKLELASEDPDIEFEQVINQPALLTLYGSDEPRHVHAMVSHFEHDEKNHVLVMCDVASVFGPIPGEDTLIYHPPTCAVTSEVYIFKYRSQILQSKVPPDPCQANRPAAAGTRGKCLRRRLELWH